MRFIRQCLIAACCVPAVLGAARAQSVTIGQTAVLSAADAQNGNLLLAQSASLAKAATVQSLSFYVAAASGNLILGIYDATGPGGGPGALKASTASFTPAKGWNTAKVATPVSLAAGKYWLAYLPSSGALSFVKTNASGACSYYSYKFGALPGKFSTSPASCAPTTWSFYATLAATSSTSPNAVNGACGSSNGASLGSAPNANGLCTAGTASTVSGAGPWSWTCAGSGGGTTATCSAKKTASATPVNGACGSSNGATLSSAPAANLCTTGAASAVSGAGPWSWNCGGANGGSTATCSATKTASSGSTGGTPSGGSDPASGLLTSDRDATANWKMSGMLSQGGIPNRTTVCKTLSPLGAGKDDTANIQSAIEACPVGQVVSLAAGTFTIGEGNFVQLDRGVTLRGAGAGATKLQRTNGAKLNSYAPGSSPSPIIIVGPGRWFNGFKTTTTLSADVAAGSKSVKVASAAGFSVGQIVLLDEASGAGWQKDVVWPSRQIWASPDYRVVWQKHNPAYSGVDDFDAGQYPTTAASAGCWFSNCDRPTNEMHQITAISGNTITFNSPVTISYRASHKAQLYAYTAAFVQNAGVENMTLSGGDDGNLRFEQAAYCWAKNVEDTLWLGEGIAIDYSFRVQLEEFYVHNAAWPVNGGGGYAISFAQGSSEALIENGISVLANKVMVARSSGTGSVIAYNYMDDGYINGSDAWVETGLNGSHMVGAHHMLFEGNYSFNTDSDQTHGNSIYHTYFRNDFSGYRKAFKALDGTSVNDAANQPAGVGPLRAISAHAYAYWMSYIGNVLGTPGQMTGWTYDAISGTNNIPTRAIWMLGWVDITPQGYDPKVAATAIRDGNYDYGTNKVAWAASDTAHKLPNSLYLTAAPAFFNTGSKYTWPWVNPTGSAQVLTGCGGKCSGLPAKARFDAGTPFTQP